MPTHDEVTAAVHRSRDPELATWVASARDYVLQPTDLTVPGHTVWRLTPVEVSHPMSVFLVERELDGQLVVTSGNAEGLGQVIIDAREVFLGEGGARLTTQLLAESAGALTLVERAEQVEGLPIAVQAAFEPPRVWAAADGVHARLLVVDDVGRLVRLDLAVPAKGPTLLETTTVATNVEIGP